jgi:hypothetical protein
MCNTADVTGGKPSAVRSQSISGVSSVNPLVSFCLEEMEKEIVFCFVPDATRDEMFHMSVRVIDSVLIDQQSVGKRSVRLMGTVNVKKRFYLLACRQFLTESHIVTRLGMSEHHFRI